MTGKVKEDNIIVRFYLLTYEWCQAGVSAPSLEVGAVDVSAFWEAAVLHLTSHQPVHTSLQSSTFNFNVLGRLAEALHHKCSQPGRSILVPLVSPEDSSLEGPASSSSSSGGAHLFLPPPPLLSFLHIQCHLSCIQPCLA